MIAARRLFLSALAALAAAPASASDRRDPDAVYHLVDVVKVEFVLASLHNHGAGAEGHPKLAVVIHGPALQMFRRGTANPSVVGAVSELVKAGVAFYACANTLAALKWTLADLVPGFALAERGGVVKLAELQGQGFAYLRP